MAVLILVRSAQKREVPPWPEAFSRENLSQHGFCRYLLFENSSHYRCCTFEAFQLPSTLIDKNLSVGFRLMRVRLRDPRQARWRMTDDGWRMTDNGLTILSSLRSETDQLWSAFRCLAVSAERSPGRNKSTQTIGLKRSVCGKFVWKLIWSDFRWTESLRWRRPSTASRGPSSSSCSCSGEVSSNLLN